MIAAIVSIAGVAMVGVIVILMINLHRQNERMARVLREDERRP